MPPTLDWSKSVVIDHADAVFIEQLADQIGSEWQRRDIALVAVTRVRAARFRVDFPAEPPLTSWRIALLVQLEGVCFVESRGESTELQAGDWRWIDPRYACSIRSDRLSQLVVEMPRCVFSHERSILSLLSHRESSPAMASAVIAVADALFERIAVADDPACLVLAESLARMAALSGSVHAVAPVPQDTVMILGKALALIEAGFGDTALSANLVAHKLGLPRRTLDKHFAWRRQTTDDAIRAIRVQHAARMLAEPNDCPPTVAEVAAACGFSEQSSLNRSFRRHFGTTPTAFRRRRETR